MKAQITRVVLLPQGLFDPLWSRQILHASEDRVCRQLDDSRLAVSSGTAGHSANRERLARVSLSVGKNSHVVALQRIVDHTLQIAVEDFTSRDSRLEDPVEVERLFGVQVMNRSLVIRDLPLTLLLLFVFLKGLQAHRNVDVIV